MADLRLIGFTLNPYNPYVTNKIIGSHQMTICLHVDDLLIGHISLFSSGTSMLLIKLMTIVVGILGPFLLLVPGRLQIHQSNKKVNNKSSKETQLLAVHDKPSNILWTRHLLVAQGYTINENIIFQDNMRGIPDGIPENSGEFPIPDPFSTLFFRFGFRFRTEKSFPPPLATFAPILFAN